MIGGIYSDQKCPICGSSFKDDRKTGLYCPNHPEQRASRFKVIFKDNLTKRFTNYEEAEYYLNGLRFKTTEGTFDLRDYKSDNPLGFETLATAWLERKKDIICHKSYGNLNRYMKAAIKAWGNTNIKKIGYGQLEDFLIDQRKTHKNKTVSNIRSCLHDFWKWVAKREKIAMPEFPEVSFTLGVRKIISKDTQQYIIDDVYRSTFHINTKVFLGIKWLATYIALRPGALNKVLEEDVNLDTGYLRIMFPKRPDGGNDKEGGDPIYIPLLEEDIEIIKTLQRGFPKQRFFRHVGGIKGCKEGTPFADNYFYEKWKESCRNLGIEDVDLYGGTRHSSATALKSRDKYSAEDIKRGTMHGKANKAFDRYLQFPDEEVLEMYRHAMPKMPAPATDKPARQADKELTNKVIPIYKQKPQQIQ